MPITVVAMMVVGALSILWPGPKMDHRPPASGGVFAPRIDRTDSHDRALVDVVMERPSQEVRSA